MAKIITPQMVSMLLPVVLALAEAAAAKTETKVDDKLVEVLKNPLVQAFLLSLLAGDEPTPKTEEEKIVAENAATIKALYACAESLVS